MLMIDCANYRAMGFIDPEEWAAFMLALRSPLPACFRINPNYPFAGELAKQLHEFVGKSFIAEGGGTVQAVEQMKWYPGGLGYKLGTDRRNLRRLPELQRLHKWMMQQTDCGYLTRQEAVSMVDLPNMLL